MFPVMSPEDANDERYTPPVTPVEWFNSRQQTFTIFVRLPSEEICTLRDVPSGITAFDLKGKMELVVGLPSQIYTLTYPDGEEIQDHQRLIEGGNVEDGYILKIQLQDYWESLYKAVLKNNPELMYHNGEVLLQGNFRAKSRDATSIVSVDRERGSVALFLAAFLGFHRMVNTLMSLDVDVIQCTPFGRTPLHAASARDNLSILDLLLEHGASISTTDYNGSSAYDIAKEMSSKLCVRRLRTLRLNLCGMTSSNSSRDVRCESTLINEKETVQVDNSQVIEQDEEESHGINKTIDTQSFELQQQTKEPRFNITGQESIISLESPDCPPGKEENAIITSPTPRERVNTEYNGGNSRMHENVQFSKARTRQLRTSPKHIKTKRKLRRKNKVTAKNSQTVEQKQHSGAFEKWLAKKRDEAERSEDDDDSEEDTDDEDDSLRRFNKRVRNMNRLDRRTYLPVADLFIIRSCPPEERIIPSPYEHITAYREYKKRRRQKDFPSAQIPRDIKKEKRLLEKQRHRFLTSAITYEEWLDHSEERKQLINRISKIKLWEMV